MNNYFSKLLLLTFFTIICFHNNLLGQAIADCVGALTICETTYPYSDPLTGNGAENPGFTLYDYGSSSPVIGTSGTPCTQGANAIIPTAGQAWYYFQVKESGSLCMSISPTSNSLDEDYDWVVFNVTNKTCEDVENDISIIVDCNFNTNTSSNVTGPNGQAGFQNGSCLNVLQGEEYLFFVSRSNSSNASSFSGFSINIDNAGQPGAANIIDNVNPEMTAVNTNPNCGDNTFDLTLSELISCSSVTPSDFTLTNPAGISIPINSVVSQGCSDGITNRSDVFTFNLGAGLSPAGVFTLEVVGDILDMCGNPIVNLTQTFEITTNWDATVSTTPTLCEGNTGTATLNPTNAAGTVNYEWSAAGVGNSSTANNLDSGNYTVTLSDGSGCDIVKNVYVPLSTPTFNVTDDVINTNCTGSVGLAEIINVGNAQAPLTYLWSNGDTDEKIENVSAGNYTVTITDDNGCENTHNVTIGSITPVLIINFTTTPSGCVGNNGSATVVSVNGSATPLNYAWDLSNGGTPSINQLTGIGPGNYIVTVTDGNGCVVTDDVSVSQTGSSIDIDFLVDPAICTSNSGVASITNIQNAVGNISYSWSNGDADSVLSDVSSGTYMVTITDEDQCSLIETVDIPLNNIGLTLNVTTDPSICGGPFGLATITAVNNATEPISYTWDLSNGMADSNGNKLFNATDATYLVTVVDTFGCSVQQDITIGLNNIVIDATVDIVPAVCESPSGSATVSSVTNGTSPFVYSWTLGGGNTATIDNLIAATYNVTVTDSFGCETIETFDVTSVNDPSLEISLLNSSDVLCFGENTGEAEVTAQGGTGVLTFTWSDPLAAGNNYDEFLAGSYSAYVTDVNGCIDSLEFSISEPDQIVTNVNVTDTIMCIGGDLALSATVTGGTGVFSYEWTDDLGNILGNTQSISISPDQGIIVSLLVSDVNNCELSQPVTSIQFFPELQADITGSYEICEGDDVNIGVEVLGGSGQFYYEWSDGSFDPAITVSPLLDTWYYVTVSNGPNCTTPPKEDSVLVEVSQLAAVNFSADVLEGCPPLEVSFEALDFDPSLSYTWVFGDGVQKVTNSKFEIYSYTNSGCVDVQLNVTTNEGCVSSKTENCFINIYPTPDPKFRYGPENPTNLSPLVTFYDLTPDVFFRSWIINETDFYTDSIFNYRFPGAGEFPVILSVTNEFGCIDSLFSSVFVDFETVIYVPNAFTPNLDPLNAEFGPLGEGIEKEGYEFIVFDRWGNEIFKTNDFASKWNGRYLNNGSICQEGVYGYIIMYKNHLLQTETISGHVTLLHPVE